MADAFSTQYNPNPNPNPNRMLSRHNITRFKARDTNQTITSPDLHTTRPLRVGRGSTRVMCWGWVYDYGYGYGYCYYDNYK